ncbi:MAG TPA: VOC family protein [Blastocatellia bacterium]|nr:VOC family protein [Blastocatellia bacterium]
MLESAEMMGFVFTKDYDKARAFYEGSLSFKFVSLDQFALVMNTGKNLIRIVKLPDFTPAKATVLGWEVKDIEASVAALSRNGVLFEDYPFIEDRERLIWTAPDGSKVAWFKDPDGNVLSVSQH